MEAPSRFKYGCALEIERKRGFHDGIVFSKIFEILKDQTPSFKL
jgi:hypothetical protein